MIKFVSFYKQVGAEAKSKKLVRRVNLKKFSYEKCLKYLIDTFNYYNPNHKFLIATDKHTVLPNFDVPIIRDDLSNFLIMEAITRSNTNYVLNNSGKIILAGADHLICGPLDKFFEEDFDLAFWIFPKYDPSHRISVSMTIVLVNKTKENKDKIDNFFKEREKICFSLEKKERQWFADQKSLSLLLETKNIISDYHKYSGEKTIFDFNGLKIKFFKYGKKYLTDVQDNGNLQLDSNSVLVDFPGHNSKEHIDNIYNIIKQEKQDANL